MVSGGMVQEVRAMIDGIEAMIFDFDVAETMDDTTEKLFEDFYDFTKKEFKYRVPLMPPKVLDTIQPKID